MGSVSWYASIFLERLRKHTVKIISLGQEMNQGHPKYNAKGCGLDSSGSGQVQVADTCNMVMSLQAL
jgi:hypothetical protein